MTPFEYLIIKSLEQARRDRAGVTAPTLAIQARLPMGVPDRSLRYYLSKMEKRGYLQRPMGPKSGWALSRPVQRGLMARSSHQLVQ